VNAFHGVNAAVAQGPSGSAFHLLADGTVLRGDDVVRELPVSVRRGGRTGSRSRRTRRSRPEDAVLDTERVAVVLPEGVAGDLGDPAVEVLR